MASRRSVASERAALNDMGIAHMVVEECAIQEQNKDVRSTVNQATETPIRPGLDPEIVSVLAERDATFEQDKKTTLPASQAMAEIRRNLRTQSPR
jgi:hypothetical protein